MSVSLPLDRPPIDSGCHRVLSLLPASSAANSHEELSKKGLPTIFLAQAAPIGFQKKLFGEIFVHVVSHLGL